LLNSKNSKLILGIDPGSHKTGYGLIEISGKSIKYIKSGTIKLGDGEFFERMLTLKVEMDAVVKECNPTEVALESLIYVKSPTALFKLAQARGVIVSTLLDDFQGKIFEYSPNLVKSSSVGHGHADKKSVQKAISMITGVKEFETDDESDALAVAICHALNNSRVSVTSVRASKKATGRGLSAALAHKVKGLS
jgi:crossover junction endodeoxyribonuclease RuvC